MRDSRIHLIFEGTNEILRCFLALSGMRGPSEKLKALGKLTNIGTALEDPIKSLGVLTDFAKNRVSKLIATRSLSKVHPKLESWSGEFSSMLGGFSIQVENTLMKYGKDIIGNEMPQKRIANMTVHLYAMLAVMSRTTAILNDEKIKDDEKDYVFGLAELALRRSQHEFISNLKSMTKNQDKIITKVSDAVAKRGGYGLDIVDY
jgi:acyl-CoA dehydrogenase family protein 9